MNVSFNKTGIVSSPHHVINDNILADTNRGSYCWNPASGNGAYSLASSGEGAKYTVTTKATNWCVFSFRPTNNNEVMNKLHNVGKFTLSFDIRGSVATSGLVPRYVNGDATKSLINWPAFSFPANEWYHYVGTATSTGDVVSMQNFYINYLFEVGTYEFKNLKIEAGEVATPYCHHPNDADYSTNIINPNLLVNTDFSSRY